MSVWRVLICLLAGLLHVVFASALGTYRAEAQTVVWHPVDFLGGEAPPVHSSEALASSTSPALIGAVVGGAGGGLAGLLFAHESCDDDPCSGGAYVLAGVGGAALLGVMGGVIGAQARDPLTARRNLWTGTAVGAAVGATAGVILVVASCGGQACGPAGYISVAMVGGSLLGAAGAVIGSRVGRVSQALGMGDVSAVPILGPSASGMLVGVRIPV